MLFFACFSFFLATTTAQSNWTLISTLPWVYTPKDVGNSVVSHNSVYFLADPTNHLVQIVDCQTVSFLTPINFTIGTPAFLVPTSEGPFGITLVTFVNGTFVQEVWAAMGNSYVCIANTLDAAPYKCINTGGVGAIGSLAYDNVRELVVVTNPNEKVPFITYIAATTKDIAYSTTVTTNGGIGQPLYNPVTELMYISVPSTDSNPIGEVNVYSGVTLITVIQEDNCKSQGLAFGADGSTLFMVCGTDDPSHVHTLVYDAQTHAKLADITGVNNGTSAAFGSNYNQFFGTGYPQNSFGRRQVFTVVNGDDFSLLQEVPTGGDISHSISFDTISGYVFVPLEAGIGAYALGAVVMPIVSLIFSLSMLIFVI